MTINRLYKTPLQPTLGQYTANVLFGTPETQEFLAGKSAAALKLVSPQAQPSNPIPGITRFAPEPPMQGGPKLGGGTWTTVLVGLGLMYFSPKAEEWLRTPPTGDYKPTPEEGIDKLLRRLHQEAERALQIATLETELRQLIASGQGDSGRAHLLKQELAEAQNTATGPTPNRVAITSSTAAAEPVTPTPTPSKTSPDDPPESPDSGALRSYMRNRRILVVDDFEFLLPVLKTNLGRFFSDVETLADPRQVVAALTRARDEGRPFDAMVLDLKMPHMNGDELLRTLAQEGLLLPVVIHSGSHAGTLQMHLFPQIDAARTEIIGARLEALAQAEREFDAIGSMEELNAWRARWVRATDGVPMAFVAKDTWSRGDEDAPHAALARALARVIATNGEVDWAHFQTVVARFQPALIEQGDITAYVETLVQMRIQTEGLAREFMNYIRTMNIPGLDEDPSWKGALKGIERLGGEEFSYQGLSDPKTGTYNRHNLSVVMGTVKNRFCTGLPRQFPDILEQTEFKQQRRAFMKQIEAMGEEIYRAADAWRQTKSPRDIALLVDEEVHTWAPGATVTRRNPNVTIVLADAEVTHFKALIAQPLMNAAQWAGPGGTVNVEVRRTPIAELDPASREYFQNTHGLPNESDVVTITIRDNGPGIPPENLPRLFDSGFTTREGGTGQGLYMLKNDIGKFNGTVHVESTVGDGTTVYLHFVP